MKNVILALAVLILAAGSCYAGTITYIDVTLGYWDGSAFSGGGGEWNTSGSYYWGIGVTDPGFGNPLWVTSDTSDLNLPDGEYWLYMATNGATDPHAVQITLGYAGGSDVEVFTTSAGTPEEDVGDYTLVSGSGFAANLAYAPQSTSELVGANYTYASDGTPNWIVDLDSGAAPEPGSWVLLATGLAALIYFGRRRKLA
jgi:hypothetical protein